MILGTLLEKYLNQDLDSYCAGRQALPFINEKAPAARNLDDVEI